MSSTPLTQQNHQHSWKFCLVTVPFCPREQCPLWPFPSAKPSAHHWEVLACSNTWEPSLLASFLLWQPVHCVKASSVCRRGGKNDSVMQMSLQCSHTLSWPGPAGAAGAGSGSQGTALWWQRLLHFGFSRNFSGVWMRKGAAFEFKKSWKTFNSWTNSQSLFL